MLKFEQLDISFVNEKAKVLQIERIKSTLEASIDSIPKMLLETCFNFLFGCLWIRFTPLFEKVQQTLQVLISSQPDIFMQRSLTILKNLSLLTQTAHDIDQLHALLGFSQECGDQSLVKQAFNEATNLGEDFMDVRDVFYNFGKSLDIPTVMEAKQYREGLLTIFYEFLDAEYSPLFLSRRMHSSVSGEIALLDNMTYANMVDSESYKTYRRQAYNKLYCFTEMLQKAESLRKIPHLAKLQELMMRLLNISDTKLQKMALDCLLKADDKGVLR